MSTFTLSISILSIVVSVTALVAVSTIYRLQISLQELFHQQVEQREPRRASFKEFAGSELSIGLVVQGECSACAERASRLHKAAIGGAFSAFLLSADNSADSYTSDNVPSVVSPRIVGQLFINATPTAVAFDHEGFEIRRRVVGSNKSLDSFVAEVLSATNTTETFRAI